MNTLLVKPDELAIVHEILARCIPEREVWAFGSRVSGACKPYSDLDLVVIGQNPLPLSLLAELEEAFTESPLSFKVDLVDWATTQESFRGIIQQNYLVIQSASTGSPICSDAKV
jgi:predicted nucleotidyltransferase